MRRIATVVATGAVATVAGLGLMATSASADTAVSANNWGSGAASNSRVTLHAWHTSGKSGLAGVVAKGKWGKTSSKTYICVSVHDSKADGKSPGLEARTTRGGHNYYTVFTKNSGTPCFSTKRASHLVVREVLGHKVSGNKFHITKAARSYKKLY